MKKNYLYVTNDNRVVVKNLGIVKRSATPLSKLIWERYIKPRLLATGSCKFKHQELLNLVWKHIHEDLSLVAVRKSVYDIETYNSTTCHQAIISRRYGKGVHFLIPNTVYGIGKTKKYCTIEEFRERKINYSAIDMDTIRNELDYFVDKTPTLTFP